MLALVMCGFVFTQCGEDEPMVDEQFTLLGTWDFVKVDASAGIINGSDPDPTGCISFKEDGTGISFFNFHIPPLNELDFASDTIQWVGDGNVPPQFVTITQSDGQVFDWFFTVGGVDDCTAKFDYPFIDPLLGGTLDVETTVTLARK